MAKQNEGEPTIKFEDKEYLVSELSDEAKMQLQGLQFAEAEINRLKGLLALAQTAANAYRSALVNKLSESKE